MAAKLGSLRFDLRADTATLSRDLQKGKKLSQKFAKDLNKTFSAGRKAVNKYGKALGVMGGAGAAAFAALTKQSLDFADNIGKVADRVGVSTDALQELRFAANQSGVATETLDMAIQRFSRRVGEAAQGTGELLPTLQQYGIAVRDNNGAIRSNEAILADLSDAMSGVESDQEALGIATKAFDSEGAALVKTLRNGSGALAEMRQKARDMGVVIEEDLIRNAEAANDQMDILGKIVSANVVTAFAKLAPLIQAVSKQITEELTGGIGEADDVSDQFLETAIDGLKTAISVLGVFLDGIRGIQIGFKAAEVSAAKMDAAFVVVFESINRLIVAFQKEFNRRVAGPIKAAGEVLGKDWDFTVDVNTTTDFDVLISESADKIKEAREELVELASKKLPSQKLDEFLDGVLEKLKKIREESKNQKEEGGITVPVSTKKTGGAAGGTEDELSAMDKYKNRLIETQAELDRFFDKQSALDELFLQGKISSEVYREELEKLNPALDDIGNKGEDVFSELEKAVAGWASQFSGQLNDLVWEADASFNDILKSFGKMITQIIIQKTLVEPLLAGFNITPNAQGNAFRNGSVTPFAKGGIVTKPKIFPMADGAGLMGEAGPEAVMPLTRMPGGNLGVEATGGGGSEVNIQIINENSQSIETETRSEDGNHEIRLRIREEVSNDIATGGMVGKTMESRYGLKASGVKR